jgi:predicted signal transduction protein with EAL and GGDEF domain
VSDSPLLGELTDLVAYVRRDGLVLDALGGRGLPLAVEPPYAHRRLNDLWPEEVAGLMLRQLRRSLADRGAAEASFEIDSRRCHATFTAKGADRVLLVVREARGQPAQASESADRGGREGVRGTGRDALERRAFFARLEQSIADAALRERHLAVCVFHVDGLQNVGAIIDYGIADRVAAALVERLPRPMAAGCTWYVGRLSEQMIAAVVENFDEREALRATALELWRSLGEPIVEADTTFQLRACGGVAVLGEDARRAGPLLEHARSAMHEARRDSSEPLRFYSDTLRIHSLARLDLERELRLAIDEDGLALRYALRCDLATQRPVAVLAYLRWPHPLRGEVRAAEFLPIAESTGLAGPLSRWALRRFQRDLPQLRSRVDGRVKWSFGALRQHLAGDVLARDVGAWLSSGEVDASDIELRFSEHALGNLSSAGSLLRRLERLGVALTVDEFGRGYSSLPRLARLPLHGLQLDRSLAVSATDDPVAQRAARAALAVATSLGLVPIATGVDDADRRRHMHDLGWVEGLGDEFGVVQLDASGAPRAAARSAG